MYYMPTEVCLAGGMNTNNELITSTAFVYPNTATYLESGNSFTCAIRASDKKIYCWGKDYGSNILVPSGLNANGVIDVSAGSDHACGIDAGGVVSCWGTNINSKLIFIVVSSDTMAISVEAGEQHNCRLQADGAIRCWGLNTFGQITVPSGFN